MGQYVAHDPKSTRCEAIDKCKDCTWPPCPVGETCQDKCWAVEYKKYYASHYYSLSGADKMKKELYTHGPISCGVQATDKFESYTGGVYKEHHLFPMINHEIAVVGWGVDEASGEGYWIGRNSWVPTGVRTVSSRCPWRNTWISVSPATAPPVSQASTRPSMNQSSSSDHGLIQAYL